MARDAARGAVDELVAVAAREELGVRVEVARCRVSVTLRGDGGRPSRDPVGTPVGPTDEQARVVVPDGAGADEDRVAGGPHASTRSKSAVVRQQQPPVGRVVEVAVERHAAAEQGVGRSATRGPRSAGSAA